MPDFAALREAMVQRHIAARGIDDPAILAAFRAVPREAFVEVVDFVVAQAKAAPNAVFAGSVPYLMLAGNLVAGWQLARSLLVARTLIETGTGAESAFMHAKIATARFYAEHILNKAPGVRDSIVHGADSVTAMALDAF